MRSHQNTLIIVGVGTMVFGLWTVIKYAGVMLMRRGIILEQFKKSKQLGSILQAGIPDSVIFNIMFVMVLIILILDLLLRLYVGTSAVAEGRGTRRRKNGFYIFIAVIMILFGISSIVASIMGGFAAHQDEELSFFGDNNSITALIIEATSTIMLMQMVHSAHIVRKYNRLGKHAKVK